jgi:hypothetical protein
VPTHARRGIVVALVLALMCVAVPAFGSAAPAAATVGRCLTGHLRLSFVRSEGATSHRFWDLALRNVGPGRCRLQGYPGVGLLDKHGRLIDVNVEREDAARPSVVLGVGQRAFFTFSYVVSGPCLPHFFRAYGLQVIPPNRTHRLVLHSGRFDVCAVSVGGHPDVYPLRSGLEL